MAIEFKMEIQGLDKLRANFSKAPELVYTELQKGINLSALKVTEAIKSVTPVKTSALKGSIRATFGKLKATISPHKNYSIYVHNGTKPHIILPKTKLALCWKGALHPVRSVMHPGTKGTPFMEIGLNNSKAEVENIMNDAVNNILNKLADI